MRTRLLFILAAVLLVALFLADIAVGSVALPLKQVWQALTGGDAPEAVAAIVNRFRLPKAVAALLAGAGLSASGLMMQTLFRNPLAGPYVLGVSSGASLGVSLLLMGLPLMGAGAAQSALFNLGMVGAAWIGSALVLLLVMAVSARVKDIMTILILGMLLGSACAAVVDILQYLSPEGAVKSFVVWTMGSLGSLTVSRLAIFAPVLAIGLGMAVFVIKPLNAMLLGENYARTMGVSIPWTRGLIFVSTVALAGTITAFCGPIGFIGIAVPHLSRMLFRTADHRILMPASILTGGIVLLLCDLVSQLPGTEAILPINTVTALLGIPIVIWVVVKNHKFF